MSPNIVATMLLARLFMKCAFFIFTWTDPFPIIHAPLARTIPLFFRQTL